MLLSQLCCGGQCTSDHQEKRKGSSFQVANGTHIPSYGTKTLSLDLGVDHKLIFTFIVTDVSKPFLGADFLHHSDQLIDLARNISLVDRNIAAPRSINLVIKLLLSATLTNHPFIVISSNLSYLSQNHVSTKAVFDTIFLITLSQMDHQSLLDFGASVLRNYK